MNALLKLLGADSEDKAIEIVNAYGSFMADLRAVTGAPSAEVGALLTAVTNAVESGKTLAAEKTGLEKDVVSAKGDLTKMLEAVGEPTVDAALGSIATAKAARDELLPAANAKLAEHKAKDEADQKAKDDAEAASLLSKLKADNKISPTQEATLWPALSLESKRSFAATAPVIELSKDKGIQESGAAPGAITAGGKSYADMTFKERADLKRENKTLFESLRAAHEAAETTP